MGSQKVFISYSHDSPTHEEQVLALSERLRADGIDTMLDQYVGGSPRQGWPRWMLDTLDAAESVLVICTQSYYRRFRGHEEPEKGKGADWEGTLITQEIYDSRSTSLKFIPVLFSYTDEHFIPEPLRSKTYYAVTSEAGYLALYDFLLDQAGVEPAVLGAVKTKPRRKGKPLTFESDSAPSASQVAPTRLLHGADRLFGRDKELAALDEIAHDLSKKVLTIVAWSGVGKTSLVVEWMNRQAANNWQGFERVFDWSFFNQGTKGSEEGGASAGAFISAALKFFGDEAMADSPASPWDKGARLATLVAQHRSLLVLDGIEPLQHPPGPMAGELKDPAIATLLVGLARQNRGLCIVTTRERVTDLASFRQTTAPEWQLESLPAEAGVELLKSLGVHGTVDELQKLFDDVRGHALTTNLIGRYLAKAHHGDIRKRDQVKFENADEKIQGGYAFKAIGAYEKWFGEGGEDGTRALAVLRTLGLFDRPAEAGCINALRAAPPIEGLTEPLIGLDDVDWNLTLSSLADSGLVSLPTDESIHGNTETRIDSHPLVRGYFAKLLREKKPGAWRAAHQRLYEHLRDSTEDIDNPTLEDLQPLYQAVAHACKAGLYFSSLEVYGNRILRGELYSVDKLGAVGADLALLRDFFEKPWSRLKPELPESEQAWVLNAAAYCLRALGRLPEAREPSEFAVLSRVKMQDWENAGLESINQSAGELVLGELIAAERDAKAAVDYADRGANLDWQIGSRTTLSDAILYLGRQQEAAEHCRQAESIHRAKYGSRLLVAWAGFSHCDVLLSDPERVAWRFEMKCEQTSGRDVAEGISLFETIESAFSQATTAPWEQGRLLNVGLDNLTLGRMALYRALFNRGKQQLHSARDLLVKAVDNLRASGHQDYIPRGLLTLCWLRVLEGDIGHASLDLNEAWEIAERGPMRLFMADIHLYRARLFHAVKPYPWNKFADGSEGRGPKDDLADARKLIEQCGYWRRKEELEDAEEAAKDW